MARTFAIKDRSAPISLQHWLAWDRLKRGSDAAIACMLIVFTLPLMAIVALAIKCSSLGPVFEHQERIGPDGRYFLFVRFRTTVQRGGIGRTNSTGLGQFLRFVRIDELPQLFNVVRGHMSLRDFRN
jgi:lipopolysaccharide/colanic/teichoic acid biosynthesis glycosyltransferase